MAVPLKNYRKFILDEYNQRKSKNKSYSMRAYARDLEIPASRLSELINGKAGISEQRAGKLAEKLNLSDQKRELFFDLVQAEHGRTPLLKKSADLRLKVRSLDDKQFSEAQFSVVADWYHAALMETLTLNEIAHTTEAFSKKLGIQQKEAEAALLNLTQLGFIENQNGRYVPVKRDAATTMDIPSAAIRQFYKQILNKSENAIEKKPMPERDHSAAVFAFDKDQIDTVKDRIRSFRRELMTEFQSTGSQNSVYCLAIQMFELTESV